MIKYVVKKVPIFIRLLSDKIAKKSINFSEIKHCKKIK